MYYIYVIVFPLVILLLGGYLKKEKLNTFGGITSCIFRMLPTLWLYVFFIYFLEMEEYIDIGWVFYTLLFFMLPISIIVIIIEFFFRVLKIKRNKKS